MVLSGIRLLVEGRKVVQGNPRMEAVTGEQTADRPVFTFSLRSSIVVCWTISVILGIICVLLAVIGILPIVPGLFLAFEALLFLRVWSNHPRRAVFYRTYMRLDDAGSTTNVGYDSVENATKVKVFPILGSRVHLRIKVKNIERPFIITSNPRLTTLETDLYSWLQERIQHKGE